MKPLRVSEYDARDMDLAQIAKQAGARYALEIIAECRHRHAGAVSPSLGLAVCEQESGFRSVFGHDATTSIPDAWKGEQVTLSRYDIYSFAVDCLGRGAQGVGPFQLTWRPLQLEADRDGGCASPAVNIATALNHLAGLVKASGERDGLAIYNDGKASSAKGIKYANEVLARKKHWHDVLG